MDFLNHNDYRNYETSEILMKCIDEERIDALRSILYELASRPDFHKQVDGICCEAGTLLHYAVFCDSVDVVRALLSSDVNPCIQNDANQTAYHIAKTDGIKNAFIHVLMQAVAQSNVRRVCQIISSGVPVNSVDSSDTKNSILHCAASFGNVEVTRVICESGAEVNFKNVNGETPLHEAVRRGDDNVVKYLLMYGADASCIDANGVDCYQLASQVGGSVIQTLSMNSLNRSIRRSTSMDSEIDLISVISNESTATNFLQRPVGTMCLKAESWIDLLWPRPKFITIDSKCRTLNFPIDNRLKIYFDATSEGEPRRIMQVIQMSSQLLASISLELEFRGFKTTESSSLDGKVCCGIFASGENGGSYTLSISETGIEIYGVDYYGLRYGFATLLQILRLHRKIIEKNDSAISSDQLRSGPVLSTSNISVLSNPTNESIPFLTIRDAPDMNVRALFQDFSGCRVFNMETLLQLAARIGCFKATHIFIHFEVRTTDRYQLPYTKRDLFHAQQVCEELFIQLVPSLDVQSNYVESEIAWKVIDQFLNDFPSAKSIHFGSNLAAVLVTERHLLDRVQHRVSRIFISTEVDSINIEAVNNLPPYVVLCVFGTYPFEAKELISAKLSVVLKFSTIDTGYLFASPESIARKAVLAAKLGENFPALGVMMCDLSTGCEIMPTSLSYISNIASIGVCWNKNVDIKHCCALLPRIVAEFILFDGEMEALLKQGIILGHIERQLTMYSGGRLKTETAKLDRNQPPSELSAKKDQISVFVEIILNPNNMNLERLTPVMFKKACNELKRSLRALDKFRKRLSYNLELALVLAEVQSVTELMILACCLGQFLCLYGMNPSFSPDGTTPTWKATNVKKLSAESQPLIGSTFVNFGVTNLPLTARTDLANRLLEIRARFQHSWLSRNIPSTLPNALKIFDNLFRALLPPDLHQYEKSLL